MKISRRGFLRGMGGLAGVTVLGGARDCTSIQVRRNRLFLPNWDADGFRVVQLTDLHANSPSQFMRAKDAIRLAVREKADLIALTGDYLDFLNDETRPHLQRLLEGLHAAQCPVLAIFGNHDRGDLPIPEVEAMFNRSRAKLLINQTVEIQGVTVAGIDDAIWGHADTGFITKGHFSKSLLALWHEPDTILHTPSKVSLQLSGHSHGGEICLPGGMPLHTPLMAKLFSGGFYPEAPVPLFVSKGVATVGPCRIYCPPEISVHTLFSSNGGPARSKTEKEATAHI